jgi:hypothetical protein
MSRTKKRGSRKGASTRNRTEVPSAVRTLTGEMRERRTDRIEESEVIWKEAPESRYHGDVPDYVGGGGRIVPGEPVTEPAVPVEEEPGVASKPQRRLIIS